MTRLIKRVDLILAGLISAMTPQAALASQLPLVEQVEGTVIIRRGQQWIQPRAGETELIRDDLIRVGRGGRAVIACTPGELDLNIEFVPSGPIWSIRNLCDTNRNLDRNSCAENAEFLEGMDATLPYVVTPRNGAVLGAGSMIRWNPVEGAHEYTVSIERLLSRTDWGVVWRTTTAETEIAYPDDPNVLMRDALYSITVETNAGVSSIENPSARIPTSFVIADDAADITARLQEIQSQPLPSTERIFAIVEAYTCRDQPLIADAINYLEAEVENVEALASLLLGDLYYASGLALLAEQNYIDATNSRDITLSLDSVITAEEGLARLYRRMDMPDLAISHLHQAELAAYYICDIDALDRIYRSLSSLLESEIEPPSCVAHTNQSPQFVKWLQHTNH